MTISTAKKEAFQMLLFFCCENAQKHASKRAKNHPENGVLMVFLLLFLCVLTEISLKSHRNFFFVEIHGCTIENRFFSNVIFTKYLLFPRKKQKCGSARGCFLVCIRSTWCPNGTKKTTPKHLFFLGRGGSVVPASPFDVLFY